MKRKKEKSLKPSMRENRRYILLEGSKEDAEKAILDYIGILGYAKAAPAWIKWNIISINREEIEKVRAAFILAGIKVKRVSGTLKGLNL